MQNIEVLEKTVAEIDIIVNSELDIEQKYSLVFPSLKNRLVNNLKEYGFEFNFTYNEDDKRSVLMAFLMHAKGYLNNIKAQTK